MDVNHLDNIPPWEWPQDTGQQLYNFLNDTAPEHPDRSTAVALAGDLTIINDDMASKLLEIVTSAQESESVRIRAAIALGPALEHVYVMGFDDPDDILVSESVFASIQNSFHNIYSAPDTSKLLRRRILEASVRAPQSWHFEAVKTAFNSNDDEWRLTAVFCMAYIDGFESQILEALHSDDLYTHYHAVCAAGIWELGAAWDHIANLVITEKGDKDIRIAAIEAAAYIRPREAGALFSNLFESEDEDIIDALHEAMATVRGVIDSADEDARVF
jgi:hypothetical protein